MHLGSQPGRPMPDGTRRTLGGVLVVVGVAVFAIGLLSVVIGDTSMEGFADRRTPSPLRGIMAAVIGAGLAYAGSILLRRRR